MLVIDEYLAVRVLVGAPPPGLDLDETLVLPAYRHYRLLQHIHSPGAGQLSQLLSDADQQAIRRPHPEVLQVLDLRPLLDEAAGIGAAYGSAGLLVGETLAPGFGPRWPTLVRNRTERRQTAGRDRRRSRRQRPRQRARRGALTPAAGGVQSCRLGPSNVAVFRSVRDHFVTKRPFWRPRQRCDLGIQGWA